MKAFMFPGQGSQRRGMGQGLFDTRSEFTSAESQIDDLLGYSLRELCVSDLDHRLNDTRYTQPCLYVVNALHYYQACNDGLRPDLLAGHSLGEYNALLAAGCFDFLTGLRLVKRRAELMADAPEGSMTAVIGLPSERIEAVIYEAGLTEIDVANFNSPSQIVLSGSAGDLQRVVPLLEKAGAQLCAPLPVSAAFHSRRMADAGTRFADFLGGFEFKAPDIPVIANVTGRPYPSTDPQVTIPRLLGRQIAMPVQWIQTIRYLQDRGVSKFEEIGPGSVLTNLIRNFK